jgi:predicted ATPase
LCEYAAVTDPGAVWETLAASLGVQPLMGRSLEESVLEYLSAKQLLLVLDNCEHLLGAIARQVEAITRRCPRVSLLATSREGLAVPGERLVAVPSLAVPADDAGIDALLATDAVRLFSDRAVAAKSDFSVSDRNAGAVGVLCRRLDGIPLAIELAAARVRSLSPDDLVARLDQRFKLLTRGSRAALERHQTLRHTIDWSYDLLEPAECQALNRLSVFAGACDLAAAEAVLADESLDGPDVIDALSSLVDKSLVVADSDGNDVVRYRLLESIRQYAQERLETSGETAAVRRRHADHYVGLVETAGPHLRRRGQLQWANALARDTDNLRAVLDWAIETPSADHALRLIAPLSVTGMAIGDTAREWAEAAMSIPEADSHRSFPVVAAFASFAASMGGDLQRAEARLDAAERASELHGPPPLSVRRARAVLTHFGGDEPARHDAQAWVDVARSSGDANDLADALIMLGATLLEEPGDVALAAIEEAVRVARDAGILSALALGLALLAGLVEWDENDDRMLALCDEAIDISTQLGNPIGVALATGHKGAIAFRGGDWRTALEAFVDSAGMMLDAGERTSLVGPLSMGAVALGALGHPEPSAVLLGKAATIGSFSAQVPWAAELDEQTHATNLQALGAEQVAKLAARGAVLDFADAVDYLRAQADVALREE